MENSENQAHEATATSQSLKDKLKSVIDAGRNRFENTESHGNSTAATLEVEAPEGEESVAEEAEATPSAVEEGTETAPEETAPDTGAADYITALQAEIEELRARSEDTERKLVYLQADFQNYRRRRDDEQAGLQKYANAELIKGLLPAVDNFERALKAAEQTQNYEALIGGVNGTLRQIQTFLQKAGVTTIETVGQEFDPNFHEAIGHAESDEYPANTVAEELQKGYLLHDRVLRPALVKVSQG